VVSRRRTLGVYGFTVAGIAIGVAGLVALGAMGERIVRFIEGGDRFVLGQISVAGGGVGMGAGFTGGGLLTGGTIAAIAAVPGVAAVQPQVMLPLDPTVSQFMTLTQELLLGLPPGGESPNRHYARLPVARGRALRPGDGGVAVVGASIAAARGLGPGSTLAVGGERLEVVGVLERTLTAPDRFVIVPIADARAHWVRTDPMIRTLLASGAAALTAGDLNTGAAVAWDDGEDPDAVARRIGARVRGVNVTVPGELSAALRTSTAFFTALVAGIGVLGLVIGGLSVANTVAASVLERLRDFGVKRALGATDLLIGREVLGEALGVTVSGGAVGLALAVALGSGIDRWVAPGQQLFLFSPRLLIGALIFALVLGAAAAAYATVRVVRPSPAEAIRRGT
jgi:putative ABC transport system permease protein